MPKLMNVKQLAEMLNLSLKMIYKMTAEKSIPFIKLGRRILFQEESIVNWLKEKSQ